MVTGMRAERDPAGLHHDRLRHRHIRPLRCLGHRSWPNQSPPRITSIGCALALREAGVGEIVDPGWSDRQDQLVEGSQDP
jgi:hypothetical protein